MYPRKGNSIVVIQNPIHTEKCHGLSRQVKLELHLGILLSKFLIYDKENTYFRFPLKLLNYNT